ncbi:MAG: S9 family peptidase, partial [Actinobacteria bacterium]
MGKEKAPGSAPYGAWRSPITAQMVAAGQIGVSEPHPEPGAVSWLELRPSEGGRYVLVRATDDGRTLDVTPPGTNVRTRVHEYGGGAFLVKGETVFFSNFEDQRLYRLDGDGQPRPITPEPPEPDAHRYADGRLTPHGRWFVCVRERHEGGEPVNELVAIPADGSGDPRIVASGHDFFSNPRPSPKGRRMAWLSWDHPRMPWDGGQLWVAELSADGTLEEPRLVAGGPEESIFQPDWSPEGILHFVSDRTGWWNLYREVDGRVEALAPRDEEFGVPAWLFDMSTYAFLPSGRIACLHGFAHDTRLGILDPATGRIDDLDLPYTAFRSWLESEGARLAF